MQVVLISILRVHYISTVHLQAVIMERKVASYLLTGREASGHVAYVWSIHCMHCEIHSIHRSNLTIDIAINPISTPLILDSRREL